MWLGNINMGRFLTDNEHIFAKLHEILRCVGQRRTGKKAREIEFDGEMGAVWTKYPVYCKAQMEHLVWQSSESGEDVWSPVPPKASKQYEKVQQ